MAKRAAAARWLRQTLAAQHGLMVPSDQKHPHTVDLFEANPVLHAKSISHQSEVLLIRFSRSDAWGGRDGSPASRSIFFLPIRLTSAGRAFN